MNTEDLLKQNKSLNEALAAYGDFVKELSKALNIINQAAKTAEVKLKRSIIKIV